ncbi:MAG: dihydrolipoyllysine-residue acetyltransferase [Deltaproteobacteria bacterium]|jgi:pyruvate dehydrogenase E2 component (dihydrolipoamide acetyltransferase)|nr:dihydrolipoyllysine-residue acetyltransferase [Deltaproteobacteria bacterium]
MGELQAFHLPDIGDFQDVDVVELLVSPGDRVEKEQALLVLESDKATMEVPSPCGGVVRELNVGVGDTVSEGDLIAVLESEEGGAAAAEPAAQPEEDPAADLATTAPALGTPNAMAVPTELDEGEAPPQAPSPPEAHASPSVRHLARELGVDLTLVPGSGRKGRITRDDVQGFVKASLSQGATHGVPIAGVQVAAAPQIDFAKFGETELQPLNRIRKLSAANLHRSWVTVPHVTQFDEADISDLDRFRKSQKAEAERRGVKLTFLPFMVKAVTRALSEFPHFNASLDATGESLILKRYFHIGVAVDTENGLVVPVIRDADQKGLFDLAAEMQELSERARSRKLRPSDIQGGSFSISSLGGIGGTLFTPIVNHPEVAILGVSRMEWKPVHEAGEFVPRLILPLSLSYDHRVIDGADAVRFTRRLAELLSDLRLLLL